MKKDDMNIILEEWKTCVEMANSVSHRRDTFNNIFITINTAIMSVIILHASTNIINMAILGIVINVFWLFFILNFKRLNTAKYDVISELEKKLPYKPFTREWKLAIEKNKYIKNTSVETILIFIVEVVYAIIIYKSLNKGV